MQRNSKFPSIFKSLYTHNPFYLLSTCFVLYAIKRAFRPELMGYIDPWALMASLTGFTMLAAVTAWVVVRFGKVWEDARSIVLVLVLMFLAMSVSFDELLNIYSTEAIGLLTLGFCFSVIVTEALLRSLNIRFPALFRMPFYLMLALFFFYPVFVSHEVTGLGLTATRWRIALFPTIAGAISLLLIFAIRRGTAYVSRNGTPWRWPWFPWTLFAFLALAVCGRSYSLSISFDTSVGLVTDMNSLFGGCFLIPFFLAILVLLLEIGIVEGKQNLRMGVMAAAGLLLLLALPLRGFDPTFAEFQTTFVRALASPLFLALLGLLAFYLYAWLRGIRVAEAGVVTTLLLATVVGSKTLGMSSLTLPVLWPLAALAAMQLVLSIGRRRSIHAFVSALCATAVLTALMWQPELLMYRRVAAHLCGDGVVDADGRRCRVGDARLPRRHDRAGARALVLHKPPLVSGCRFAQCGWRKRRDFVDGISAVAGSDGRRSHPALVVWNGLFSVGRPHQRPQGGSLQRVPVWDEEPKPERFGLRRVSAHSRNPVFPTNRVSSRDLPVTATNRLPVGRSIRRRVPVPAVQPMRLQFVRDLAERRHAHFADIGKIWRWESAE